MFNKKTLLTAGNLNSAFISKSDTNAQSIGSNLTIGGGAITLKNSFLSDSASASYLRIDPQGNNVIIYDGVNNQRLDVYSSSGTESTYVQTINGTASIGQIDVSSAVDHLEINTNTGKRVDFGGKIQVLNGADLAFRAGSSSDDAGDIIFQTSGGTELARIFSSSGGALNLSTGTNTDSQIRITDALISINAPTTVSGKIVASSGIGLISANSLSFDTYGGGFNMIDTTWIRTTGSKSFYMNAGTLRTDGTLQVGNNGATLNAPASGTFSVHNGKFTVSTGGAITATGPINLTTTMTADTGIKIDGVTIDTISSTNLVLRSLNQLRFSDSNIWDYNKWAGIKYDSANLKMYIGGPASAQFSSNASPASIDVSFTGIGKVGIGYDSPSKTLDINGDIRVLNNMYSPTAFGFYNDSSVPQGIKAGSIAITSNYTNNAPANGLYVQGSTGIGTVSPLKLLDVAGDIRASGNIYGGLTSIGFLNDAGGALPIKAGSLAITSSYSNSAPANGLYVQGSAGIGIATPSRLLDVNGDARIKDNIFSPSAIGLYNDTGTAQSLKVGTLVVSSSYSATPPANGLYVEGNVGIGVTGGTSKLEVAGSVKTTGSIISTATGATDVLQATGAVGVKTIRFDNGNLRFWNPTALEVATFSSGGNVGINNPTPAYKLDVNGNMNVTGILYSPASNSESIRVGDESSLWDINVANTMGLYGVANTAVGGLKLGSTGPTLYGSGNSLGIRNTSPNPAYALDIGGSIRIAPGNGIYSGYNNGYILNDHGNGNVTLSSAGGDFYVGYANTTKVRLSTALYGSNGTINIADTDGTLYYQGQNIDTRYVNSTGDAIGGNFEFYATDTSGSFDTSAIEIREVNNVTTSQSGSAYAPALAFHWGGRVQGQLALESDGTFTLRDGSSFGVNKTLNAGNLRINGNQVWHAGNDGTGSGLDADSVDGLHLSSLVRTDGTNKITGDLNFSYNTSLNVEGISAIEFFGPNANGYGVKVGAGGLTIIGSGESAQTFKTGYLAEKDASGNAIYSAGTEHTFITSDNSIFIVPGQNSAYQNTTKWEFNTNGNLYSPLYSGAGGYIDPYANIKNNQTIGNWNVYNGTTALLKVNWDGSGATIEGNLLIDNVGDVDGTNDKGLTLRDASNNVLSFDSNEMWMVGSTNVRAPYTFNASYLQLNTGGGGKRIPRISYGTAAPPTTNVMDGDIYVQY